MASILCMELCTVLLLRELAVANFRLVRRRLKDDGVMKGVREGGDKMG